MVAIVLRALNCKQTQTNLPRPSAGKVHGIPDNNAKSAASKGLRAVRRLPATRPETGFQRRPGRKAARPQARGQCRENLASGVVRRGFRRQRADDKVRRVSRGEAMQAGTKR
ncbi:MAG: hypothetical protein OXU50_00725 [Gammaproteobacteria bacterium]|nr:hypothetical protein [Gammaproteobacteria bacterium]